MKYNGHPLNTASRNSHQRLNYIREYLRETGCKRMGDMESGCCRSKRKTPLYKMWGQCVGIPEREDDMRMKGMENGCCGCVRKTPFIKCEDNEVLECLRERVDRRMRAVEGGWCCRCKRKTTIIESEDRLLEYLKERANRRMRDMESECCGYERKTPDKMWRQCWNSWEREGE